MQTPTSTKIEMTPEQFKSELAGKLYEYVRGQAIRKVNKVFQGKWIKRLMRLFETYLDEHGGDYFVETSLSLQLDDSPWHPIPDVCYFAAAQHPEQFAEDDFIPVPPVLAIEVQSPGQSLKSLREKAANYLKTGVEEVLIIKTSGGGIQCSASVEAEIDQFSSHAVPGFTCALI